MFRPLFFSQNTMMLEKLLFFSKTPQKLTVFQDVYDHHLILGEKQRLKQVENCSMIPWPSFDTHQTYKCTMIRVILWVLSLFCNFFNDETNFGPVSTIFKNTSECYCNIQGIKTTISTHYQSKFVKNSKFKNQDYVSLQGFGAHLSQCIITSDKAHCFILPFLGTHFVEQIS